MIKRSTRWRLLAKGLGLAHSPGKSREKLFSWTGCFTNLPTYVTRCPAGSSTCGVHVRDGQADRQAVRSAEISSWCRKWIYSKWIYFDEHGGEIQQFGMRVTGPHCNDAITFVEGPPQQKHIIVDINTQYSQNILSIPCCYCCQDSYPSSPFSLLHLICCFWTGSVLYSAKLLFSVNTSSSFLCIYYIFTIILNCTICVTSFEYTTTYKHHISK